MRAVVLTPDQIGTIAEQAVSTELTLPVSSADQRVIFKATQLGDKHPTVDFLVDILAPDSTSRGFFFAQVKGTMRTVPGARIPVVVATHHFNRLVDLPAPTYLIGVDARTRNAYVVAAHRLRGTGVSSITREYPLSDERVKLALYEEVAEYWKANPGKPWNTRFQDV